MPSAFSPNKNLELMVTGDFVDTWGARQSSNIYTIIDNALGSHVTIPVVATDITLSTAQIQNATFLVTGALAANVSLIFPVGAGGFFFVRNGTTGAFTLSVKTADGSTNTLTIPQGTASWVITDGTLVYIPSGPSEAFSTVASAATTDLSLAATRNVLVTGAATITAFGTAFSADYPLYCVVFSGAAVITNNAAIICPGGANITAQAGAVAWIQALSTTNVRILSFDQPDATPIVPLQSVPVRQTVLSGPVDANGFPNFWPSTSASLTLTMQNVTTTPLVIAIAKGFGSVGGLDAIVRRTTNDAIVLPASQTSYIYIDDTGALGSTIIPPIYQRGGTISITSGQHTFDITAMQMYLGNGATAPAVNRVFIGEAVTAVGTVTSTACYAYRGYYDSGQLTITAAGSETAFSHNMGVRPDSLDGRLVNISTELGYSVGWESNLWSSGSGSQGAYYVIKGNLAASIIFTTLVVINVGTQTVSTFTAAKWKVRVIARRGW